MIVSKSMQALATLKLLPGGNTVVHFFGSSCQFTSGSCKQSCKPFYRILHYFCSIRKIIKKYKSFAVPRAKILKKLNRQFDS